LTDIEAPEERLPALRAAAEKLGETRAAELLLRLREIVWKCGFGSSLLLAVWGKCCAKL
jgi:hypothetical protein